MAGRHLFKRGPKADLPLLNVGEPGFATDTKQVFVGATGGNVGLMSFLSGGSKKHEGGGSGTVVTAGVEIQVVITFPTAFSAEPTGFASFVAASFGSSGYVNVRVFTTTVSSITIGVNAFTSGTVYFNWLAIGN